LIFNRPYAYNSESRKATIMKFINVILSTLAISVTLLFTGCDALASQYELLTQSETTCNRDRSGFEGARLYLDAQLCMVGLPVLGKEVKVVFTFALSEKWHDDYMEWQRRTGNSSQSNPVQDGIKANIDLPRSFELVNGQTEWNGSLNWGETHQMEILVKPQKVGKPIISAYVGYPPDAFSWHGSGCNLYTAVFTRRGLVSESHISYVSSDPADVIKPELVEIAKIKVDLELSNMPALNQTAQLTCTVIALSRDIAKAESSIYVLQGFEVVSGDIKWEGSLTKDVPIQMISTIKAVKTGRCGIIAGAGYFDDVAGYSIGSGSDDLYLNVSDNGSVITTPPPPPPILPRGAHK
jgi:hypothetical protein